MTIRSSDVIPPSRYWFAVIAVICVSPFAAFWLDFLLGIYLRNRAIDSPNQEIRCGGTGVCPPEVVRLKS